MSAVVGMSVLKVIFEIFGKMIRSRVAKHEGDGDLTDEIFCSLIVRELDEIKRSLVGLARKDLLSSISFLQEGINQLCETQPQFPSDENTAELIHRATAVEASSSRNTDPDPSSPMNEAAALLNAVMSFNHADERFQSAVESFKIACEKATEAFCNKALPIEDRIKASQVRMVARMLEKFEDPDASVSDCLLYLKQLHEEGAIRDLFSVLIAGGVKSWFKQTRRPINNASSVHIMNKILFDFARKFAKSPPRILEWPTILLGNRICHPVFGKYCVVNNLVAVRDLSLPHPDFTFGRAVFGKCPLLNSKGEVVSIISSPNAIKIFKYSGKSFTESEVPREEHALVCQATAMDIDAEDNVYVIIELQAINDEFLRLKLCIFDENGKKKLETPLPFDQSSYNPQLRMAVNKDGRIAILNYEEKVLYIGRVCVEINSFVVEKSFGLNELRTEPFPFANLRISDLDGTKIIVIGFRNVYVYRENGQLQCTFEIPSEDSLLRCINSVAINHVTKRILFKTFHNEFSSLMSFSESGELVYCLYLGSSPWVKYAKLISHPNSPVALVGNKGATLLQQ